ncbi:hypothetical protein WM40_24800 [Robbsia andropogonis]|uniref:Uncharacterized protein n=1 Tax=Robbsia andropogonis TaxID=28092 RepID=A0A0F5JTK9_9BURK|nr:hypothetical protein [Robbsia andropogonis]KKB61156.1 hypothetical protein WM40_24800 [Robbsia andropogonis]
MGFFQIKSPLDMLEKARRERNRMVAEVHIDHVYNFFVTVAHVADYVKHSGAVEQKGSGANRWSESVTLCCSKIGGSMMSKAKGGDGHCQVGGPIT